MQVSRENSNAELVCHVKRMQPGTLALFHFHENYELCQPLNCPCDFLIDGVLIRAEPGDILAIDSRICHRFLPVFPDSQIRVLQFPVRILPPAAAAPVRTWIPRKALEEVPGLFQTVEGLMRMMEQEPTVNTGEKNPLFQSLMVSVYLLLLKYFPEQSPPKRRKEADLFFCAAEYIHRHFAEERSTVETIAKELGISREKLAELFRQYTGLYPKQYINRLRVDYANSLLLEGYNITEAAFQAGFGSIRTFNSAYKAITGMSPTDYLKTKS